MQLVARARLAPPRPVRPSARSSRGSPSPIVPRAPILKKSRRRMPSQRRTEPPLKLIMPSSLNEPRRIGGIVRDRCSN